MITICQIRDINLFLQIHLGQVCAKPTRFDARTKKAYYSILMDPVKIRTMFDHKRPIHCSLLRRNSDKKPIPTKYQSYSEKGFIINVEKGMEEGKTVQLDVENELCQVQASLTRLTASAHQELTKLDLPPIKSMAPPPLTYTLQITELSLPLSTIAT